MKQVYNKIRSKAIDWLFRVAYMIKPRYAADIMYQRAFKRRMDLEHPKNLIEKINWMQFNSDTTMWTLCADKYRMREYVTEKGFQDYLPKLYGHWENPDEINFAELPDEFVLKSNNGCGTVKIVSDKTQLDIPATKKLLRSWLKPYGYVGGQSHYLRIKPCIIAEELLHQDEDEKVFSPTSLVDYKMWCFNGEPESFFVAFNRHNTFFVNMALFDANWKPLSQYLRNTNMETYDPQAYIPKPVCLDKMLDIARKISSPFPELRLDFYVINGKPIIGEMTFTSGYGYFTDEYYEYLGSKVDLSKVKR